MVRQQDRRKAQLAAKRPREPAIEETPATADWEKFARAVLLVLMGGLVGSLVANLPIAASVWGIAGFLALFVFSHVRRKLGSWSLWGFLAALAIAIVCFVMAEREYTGANYKLKYRVCGGGMLDPYKTTPTMSKFVLGLEFPNDTGRVLYRSMGKHFLSIGDRSSVQEFPTDPNPIFPSGGGTSDAKTDDFIIFSPDGIPVKPQMAGKVHYEFKFGPRPDALRQTLIIDGEIIVTYFANGTMQRFLFVPKDTSPGYLPEECNLKEHSYGLTSEG